MPLMKKNLLAVTALICLGGIVFQCCVSRRSTTPTVTAQPPLMRDSTGKVIVDSHPDAGYLDPEESMKSIYLKPGYHLQLVAGDPMIKEPVAIVWDGNGRMFVAEMLTYMQDINGSNENLPVSRISLLEDVDGNGTMDKSTVFIDSLVLPRMMLSIGHRLLVSETYTNNIWAYSDSDNDGRADQRELVFGDSSFNHGNLEHQRSGLIWNLDNRIYTTHEDYRYKYEHGKLVADSMLNSEGQWGLANDDYGRLYYSSAGGETPALGFQLNPFYGELKYPNEVSDEFQAVWPIIATPDVQGGAKRLRPDSTLNHFTASCGQSVYRGNALPQDLYGDLLICEPVGRLIRRAKIINENGTRVLKNAYDHEEFIASTDMNFRPVNTATGPDGCLYIVDMHRGIIQEGAWTGEGSYLREQILNKGLDKNILHGRIYRLVYDGYKPDSKPSLLNASSAQLVNYLSHPNGWWRDNAQKELVVRNDKSVVSSLIKMAAGNDNHLARIHALWTLEGLNSINKEILANALKDADARVRKTAVSISEDYLKNNDGDVLKLLTSVIDDTDPDVQAQLTASLYYYRGEEADELLKKVMDKAVNKDWVKHITNSIAQGRKIQLYGEDLAELPEADRNNILKGKEIFQQVCAACHGSDGNGIGSNNNAMAAPALKGSGRIVNKNSLINILLHGLTGPVDGKTYPDVMVPFGAANNDEWVANVLSYLRFNFKPDNTDDLTFISADEVKAIRETTSARKTYWTLEELK